MRKMLYTIWFLGSLLHVGCTKDNYIDTGISNGRYHGNLMQYMGSNSYDWDSTIPVSYTHLTLPTTPYV